VDAASTASRLDEQRLVVTLMSEPALNEALEAAIARIVRRLMSPGDDVSPLEVLAEEFGAAAGRIERRTNELERRVLSLEKAQDAGKPT
jgi:hypothetical protein